jgi:hypothetical protein
VSTLTRSLASLVAGAAALVVVGASVTAVLDPVVWPSLFVGIPLGLAAGATAATATYLGLVARDERARLGAVSSRTTRRFRVSLAAFVVSVVLSGVVVAALIV